MSYTLQEQFEKATKEHNSEVLLSLINCNEIDFSSNNNDLIRSFCCNIYLYIWTVKNKLKNDEEIFRDLLINPKKIDETAHIYLRKQLNLINLLWSKNKIKQTLKHDDQTIYNMLIVLDIENKIHCF